VGSRTRLLSITRTGSSGNTQQQLAFSAQDAAQLSEMRYRGGAASYLEVLTNETNYFNAELGLAQAQANELVALVQIYQNLGGGWQQ